MGELFTALIIIAIVAANIFRVTAEMKKRGQTERDPADDRFGESELRRELERRLKEDRDRMAPPPRPGRPAPAQAPAPRQPAQPQPAPRQPQPVAAEPYALPQKTAAQLARETVPVAPQPKPARKPNQSQPTRKAVPKVHVSAAKIPPLPSGLQPVQGKRTRAARIRPESLTPSMMRKVAILSEIYNPPFALRERSQK